MPSVFEAVSVIIGLLLAATGTACHANIRMPGTIPDLAMYLYFHYSGHMKSTDVILALAALAQPTRLQTFKLLVQHEPDGIQSGDLARLLEVPHNTMSSHLAILTRAGLIAGERQSRTITYRADLARFRDVTLYLLKDCCGGRSDVCAPLIADLTPCCSPKVTA